MQLFVSKNNSKLTTTINISVFLQFKFIWA
uniref:Uncharacterized protein n=1 Tax=Arundo donax TaxID=35708 RepID=A0A0A9ES23_ARUDO